MCAQSSHTQEHRNNFHYVVDRHFVLNTAHCYVRLTSQGNPLSAKMHAHTVKRRGEREEKSREVQ